MDFLKRYILSFAFASAMAPLSGHAADAQPIAPTPSEAKAITYMKSHGVNHFLMLNKQRGQVLYVINSQITGADPALSGKKEGDNVRKNAGVTPAGIFKMEVLGDSTSIAFKQVKGTENYYTIHPVFEVEGQHRSERLESKRSVWQRISGGCVNVAVKTIRNILGLMTLPQTFKDDKSSQQVSGSFFLVLPENQPVEAILKYPEIQAPSPFN